MEPLTSDGRIWECDPDGYNQIMGRLVKSWRVDCAQTDEHRTYEVAAAKKELLDAGFKQNEVDYATDFAYSIYVASVGRAS